jgi:hypothetical protein
VGLGRLYEETLAKRVAFLFPNHNHQISQVFQHLIRADPELKRVVAAAMVKTEQNISKGVMLWFGILQGCGDVSRKDTRNRPGPWGTYTQT